MCLKRGVSYLKKVVAVKSIKKKYMANISLINIWRLIFNQIDRVFLISKVGPGGATLFCHFHRPLVGGDGYVEVGKL